METNKTIEILKNKLSKTDDPKLKEELKSKIKILQTGKEILK